MLKKYFLGNKIHKHIIERDGLKYLFNFIDATPSPGPKSELNFTGSINCKIDKKEKFDVIINFCHYPLNTMYNSKIEGGRLYFCGHLHFDLLNNFTRRINKKIT